MNNIVKNDKGLTLIELTISILVASMIMVMLMSLLTMAIKAKANLDTKSKMYTQSYIIAETLRFKISDLQGQSIELISDTATETTIYIYHDYDITINPASHLVYKDDSSKSHDILIYDKVAEEITYNGVPMHSDNVKILAEYVTIENETVKSSIELIPIGDIFCDPVLTQGTICESVIQLTLIITIEFDNGSTIEPITLITTIIL